MASKATPSTLRRLPVQIAFPGMSSVEGAVAKLAEAGVEQRGAVFTRREVVDFILDLVGYTEDQPLHKMRLLEPSFGDGDFLIPALERLFSVFRRTRTRTNAAIALKDSVRGVELHRSTFESTSARVVEFLQQQGLTGREAEALKKVWLSQEDFLLSEHSPTFTHVVGNPPYVRQEMVADELMAEYRRRYATIYDRADLYVPFIEHALNLLALNGRLGFICADRWTKNRYGGPLRRLVSDRYRLRTYIDMVDTPAFHSDVIAYPAIFIIGNEKTGPTRIAHRPPVEAKALRALAKSILHDANPTSVQTSVVVKGDEPWILDGLDQLELVRRLEAVLPTLEESGCKVGIGVATGNDKIFVGKYEALDVEPERKLPLVMTRDIVGGSVDWRGFGVLNPFLPDGTLAPLKDYPRFARFLKTYGDTIKKRHVSQKNPANWYRTIDRIYPALTNEPKLLIPDIKGAANIVYEEGRLYPHHNLYYITSREWDLHALQAVLISGIARLFVATYSTKMRGGYLRFQAQYLRRIRLPKWSTVSPQLRKALAKAGREGNKAVCDDLTAKLYGLTTADRNLITQ